MAMAPCKQQEQGRGSKGQQGLTLEDNRGSVLVCLFCIIPQGFRSGQHCINVKTISDETGQRANVTRVATNSLSSTHATSLNEDRHMASIVARPYARAVAMGKEACLVAAILGAKYRYDLVSLPGDTAFLG